MRADEESTQGGAQAEGIAEYFRYAKFQRGK
jgi:hypothetical protein